MMRRGVLFALLPLAVACGGGDDPDGGPSDSGPDAGFRFDATVVPDTGVPPDTGVDAGVMDAGFGDPATVLEGFERIEGVRTYMRIRGTTTSTMPPVVFLNTGPMLGHEYAVEPMEFLLGPGGAEDPDRLLLFYDMRMTGQSGFGTIETASVTIENHVLDLDNVIDFLDDFRGEAGPVDFVAHGYGTAVATLYAADHPERVSRMVFVAPYPSHVLEQAEWMAEWNSRLGSADRERLGEITKWNYCLRDIPRCSREIWNIIGPTWFCPENRPIFQEMTFRHVEIRPFQFHTVKFLRDQEFDFRPVMTTIPTPVTIVSGPCDPIPAAAPDNYEVHLQSAERHVIPGSGHFPMTETPEAFERIVRRALTYP